MSSRESDSAYPSSRPGGAPGRRPGEGPDAYPSGTPPYGTGTSGVPGADPFRPTGKGAAAKGSASADEAGEEFPKTETTLTTRVRINIPGSRPIPPVVVRSPLKGDGTEPGGGESAGPRHRSAGPTSPVLGVVDAAAGTSTPPNLPREWQDEPAARGAKSGSPKGGSQRNESDSTGEWFRPRQKNRQDRRRDGHVEQRQNPGIAPVPAGAPARAMEAGARTTADAPTDPRPYREGLAAGHPVADRTAGPGEIRPPRGARQSPAGRPGNRSAEPFIDEPFVDEPLAAGPQPPTGPGPGPGTGQFDGPFPDYSTQADPVEPSPHRNGPFATDGTPNGTSDGTRHRSDPFGPDGDSTDPFENDPFGNGPTPLTGPGPGPGTGQFGGPGRDPFPGRAAEAHPFENGPHQADPFVDDPFGSRSPKVDPFATGPVGGRPGPGRPQRADDGRSGLDPSIEDTAAIPHVPNGKTFGNPFAGNHLGGSGGPESGAPRGRFAEVPPAAPFPGFKTATVTPPASAPHRQDRNSLDGRTATAPAAAPPSATPAAPAAPAAKRRGRGGKLAAYAVGGLLFAGAAAYGTGLMLNQSDIPKGVTVLGTDIGGDSRDQALSALDSSVGKIGQRPVQLRIGDQTVSLDPTTAGLSFDTTATVDALTQHSYNPIEVIGSLAGQRNAVQPTVNVDDAKLKAALQSLAGSGPGLREGYVQFTDTGQTAVVPGKGGQAVDATAAVAKVEQAYRDRAAGRPDSAVAVPVTAAQPQVNPQALQAAADGLGKQVLNGTITVVAPNGRKFDFGKVTAAKALILAPDATGAVVPSWDLAKLNDALGGVFDKVKFRKNGSLVPITPQDVADAITSAFDRTGKDRTIKLPG